MSGRSKCASLQIKLICGSSEAQWSPAKLPSEWGGGAQVNKQSERPSCLIELRLTVTRNAPLVSYELTSLYQPQYHNHGIRQINQKRFESCYDSHPGFFSALFLPFDLNDESVVSNQEEVISQYNKSILGSALSGADQSLFCHEEILVI